LVASLTLNRQPHGLKRFEHEKAMMKQFQQRQQLSLLELAKRSSLSKSLDSMVRREITNLLTLLLSECVAVAERSVEASSWPSSTPTLPTFPIGTKAAS
jgi:hypothetical protein